jgi:hypothetical protein
MRPERDQRGRALRRDRQSTEARAKFVNAATTGQIHRFEQPLSLLIFTFFDDF